METQDTKDSNSGLPYVNNFWSILITVVLTAGSVWFFNRNAEISLTHVLIAAAMSGVCASAINTLISYSVVRKMRLAGALPQAVPGNRLIRILPKNPILLVIILAILFGASEALITLLFVRLYEIQTFTLLRLIVWLSGLTILIAAIGCECAVMRCVQPDCRESGEPAQTGQAKVEDPFKRVSAFKNWLGTVITDFGFNMAIGLLLGTTTVAADHSVMIKPTTRDGIIASSIILGIIFTLKLVSPIASSMLAAREKGLLPPYEKRNAFLSALPEKPKRMTWLY